MQHNDTVKTAEGLSVYEVGFLVIPSVAEEQVPTHMNAVKDIITKNGGIFVSEELPKLRPLTYEMRKKISGSYKRFSTAYFGWVKFQAEKGTVEPIKKALDEYTEVLRYLIISTVLESTLYGSKILAQEKAETEKKAKKEEKPAEPMTEAELDKTIDELVIE